MEHVIQKAKDLLLKAHKSGYSDDIIVYGFKDFGKMIGFKSDTKGADYCLVYYDGNTGGFIVVKKYFCEIGLGIDDMLSASGLDYSVYYPDYDNIGERRNNLPDGVAAHLDKELYVIHDGKRIVSVVDRYFPISIELGEKKKLFYAVCVESEL